MTEILVDGLAFAEGPRWHDGRLWFSDMHDRRVKSVGPTGGEVVVELEIDDRPSGLGGDPDGKLLVVSMVDRRLLRWGGKELEEVADLSGFVDHSCNDMVVDGGGRAYIGNFGFDFFAGDKPRDTVLHMVDTATGDIRVVADGLKFPNGMVITDDGATLVVGESYGGCLTAFTIDDDGSLSDRRTFAALDRAVPDGICLDAGGAVWVASPLSNEVVRVQDGGEVTTRVSTDDRMAIACMLGGPDRRTLFVCTATTTDPVECAEQRAGRIEVVEVGVPGAGYP